jgi:hypothetical protein
MVHSTGFSTEIFVGRLACIQKISVEKERSDISSECRRRVRSSEIIDNQRQGNMYVYSIPKIKIKPV